MAASSSAPKASSAKRVRKEKESLISPQQSQQAPGPSVNMRQIKQGLRSLNSKQLQEAVNFIFNLEQTQQPSELSTRRQAQPAPRPPADQEQTQGALDHNTRQRELQRSEAFLASKRALDASPPAGEGRIQEPPKRSSSLEDLKLVDPQQQLIMNEYDHLSQEMEQLKKTIRENRAYSKGHKKEKLVDTKVNLYTTMIQNERVSKDQVMRMEASLAKHFCYVENQEQLEDAEKRLVELEPRFERLEKYRNLVHHPDLVPGICGEVKVAPHEYGQHATFRNYQKKDETKVFCGIPNSASGVNVEFQCKEFLQFMIDIEGIEVDSDDVSTAFEFVSTITEQYESEDDYVEEAIVPFCRKYLCPSGSGFSTFHLCLTGNCKTDITIGYVDRNARDELSNWKVLVGNVEAKVSTAAGGTDPDTQNVGYYIKMIKSLKYRSIQPMFLVTFAGTILRIHGIVCNNGRVFVNRLCSDLSFSTEYKLYQKYTSFARVFKSLRKGMLALGKRYLNEQDPFPACSPVSLSAEIDGFGIYEQFIDMIFTSGDKTRCIKICESYCTESQDLLSSAGLAPRITRGAKVIELKDRRFIIVEMEFLDGYEKIGKLEDFIKTLAIDQRREILEKLEKALSILHDKDLVHGDFRNTNILVHKDTLDVKVVDFESCGKDGVATYSKLLSMKEGIIWHSEVKPGGPIKKEHDLFSLEHLVDKYKLNN